MSAYAGMKCYEWWFGVVVSENMVGINMVDGDLHPMYENNLFCVSNLYCFVTKR